jgi:hypothetical protein
MSSNDVKTVVLGYGYMLEEKIVSAFRLAYPHVKLNIPSEERTERPTIDVADYDKKPGVNFQSNSEGFSFFRAEPGFRPKLRVVPSGRKVISFIDKDGLIRYKYADNGPLT